MKTDEVYKNNAYAFDQAHQLAALLTSGGLEPRSLYRRAGLFREIVAIDPDDHEMQYDFMFGLLIDNNDPKPLPYRRMYRLAKVTVIRNTFQGYRPVRLSCEYNIFEMLGGCAFSEVMLNKIYRRDFYVALDEVHGQHPDRKFKPYYI